MTEKSRNWQQKVLNIVLKQNNFLRKGKMYGQLKRPPMEEWSKQRHVDHVALIYFQKMLQVLTSHTSKLPKKVLKNTKNMTPNSCSVRPEKFHPYVRIYFAKSIEKSYILMLSRSSKSHHPRIIIQKRPNAYEPNSYARML